jgi:hypothetical protein
MKRIIISLTLFLILTHTDLCSQIRYANPKSGSHLSLYATTIMGGILIGNISYDQLYHVKKTQMGFTSGITYICERIHANDYDSGLGVHLTYTLLAGRRNTQFEMKLGVNFTPLVWDKRGTYWLDGYYFQVLPVISAGFRKKAFNDQGFWRMALSTGGLGIGFGMNL